MIVATLFLVVDMKYRRILHAPIARFGLGVAFGASLIASLLTLVYSEVFGVIPCGLCWMERVMLYPQVLILGAALYYNDRSVVRSGIVLSVVGLVISLYHHYIQMGGSQFVKCPAAGAGADCAKRFLFEFNFVTFPLLAAITFAFLLAVYWYLRQADRTTL